MNKKIGEKIREDRLDIGAEILRAMEKASDLPLPNKYRLAKVMQEYFKSEGYADELKSQGRSWRGSPEYWTNHLKDISAILRRDGDSFDYYREEGEFKGQWKFLNKKEEGEILSREHADIGTRTDTHNGKLDDTKWKHNIPRLAEVPQLN